MISIETIYYCVATVAIICGAAYKIGCEVGKTQKSDCPAKD